MTDSFSTHPAIAIAAGGTGGHIYPALAVAQSLKRLEPEAEVHFLCGQREIELDIYRKEGIKPVVLPIGRFGGNLPQKALTAWQVWRARRRTRSFIKKTKPQCLLAFGGYVTFGAVWEAQALGVPIILHEQNALLGRAHQMAKKWARVIACAYPETIKALHGTPALLTGNPVREAFNNTDREEGRRFFELEEKELCLVVSGGSQGARSLNNLVRDSLKIMSAWTWGNKKKLTLIWATGPRQKEELAAKAAELTDDTLQVKLFDYLDRVDLAYAAADLVIGRAGAGTIAECTACGKPAILVPLPTAMNDHQRLNAQSVVERGGALMIDERESAPDKLVQQIVELLEDSERLQTMAEASRRCGRPDAADRLARLLISFAMKEKLAREEHKGQEATAVEEEAREQEAGEQDTQPDNDDNESECELESENRQDVE